MGYLDHDGFLYFTDRASFMMRLPTGKLYKRLLKDRYWGHGDSRIE